MFIEMENVVKRYGEGENVLYALRDASLSLEKGEFCVILGPSGSGKSTLMNIIGGLDHADEGRLTIDGEDLTSMSKKDLGRYRREKIGIVFQTYNLIGELTVRENIRVVSDIASDPLDIDELLEELGLQKHKGHFPSELSGGQQQRCAIARAVVKNPSLLLCDEPTGALDSASSSDVLELIQRVNRKYGTTVVLITHNEVISEMADRVLRIHDGKIVENIPGNRKDVKELVF
jgi:putative ABC transport system ATP-binding protein